MSDDEIDYSQYKFDYLVENGFLDIDFWNDLKNSDIGEAIDDYVRDSSDFYESID